MEKSNSHLFDAFPYTTQ